jgi:hypothetical protein
LKGIAVNPSRSTTGAKVYDDLEVLLRASKIISSDFSMNGEPLRSGHKAKDSVWRNVLTKLGTAYNGIIWRDLSIDLVAASLRQRIFTNRIMHECQGVDSPNEVSQAISRYHKFLQLMQKKESITGKYIPLVPTLDIDLVWHTHQLFPQSYRSWCTQHVGRAINHDDTFEKATITDGLRSTSLAWLEEYGESYTTKDLRKAYFTIRRKIAGIMFPPYGLIMLSVGRKLNRARIGIFTRFVADGIVAVRGMNANNDNCRSGGGGGNCGHGGSTCGSCGGSGGG